MIPAPAMKPIIEVAVKKAPISVSAGRIPTRVKGIGAMMTSGVLMQGWPNLLQEKNGQG
jgi:hypothetical protein